jgi:hypothetical protein
VDVYCERAKELATLMIAASVVLNHVLAVNGLSNCATDRAVRSCAPTLPRGKLPVLIRGVASQQPGTLQAFAAPAT